MKQPLPLLKKLSAFSAFAVSFLAVEKINAQIVYNDISPNDTLAFGSGPWYLDLDNNGQPDFSFEGILSSTGSVQWKTWWVSPLGFAALGTGGGGYLLPFQEGDSICSFSIYTDSQDYFFWRVVPAEITLLVGEDVFFAFDLYDPNANTINYGWLRLEVAPDTFHLIFKDYAFDTIPNECISAGLGIALGNHAIEETNLNIYPNPASSKLFISRLNANFHDTDIFVFDLLGRKILTEKISSTQNEIDVSAFPDGVYFLELKSEDQLHVKKFEVKH